MISSPARMAWPLGFALSFMVLATGASWAQAPSPAISPAELPTGSQGERLPAIQEEFRPPTRMEQVDALFQKTVAMLERALFYRIGRSERQYVLYEPQSVFFRERGTTGPFRKYDPQDSYPATELSAEQVEMLSVEGKLLPGAEVDGRLQSYRLGKIGSQPVEYLVIKRNDFPDGPIAYGDKLVYEPQQKWFRKLSPKRNRLTDVTVPASTVQIWGEEGRLTGGNAAEFGQPDYLLKEQIGGMPCVVAWLLAGGILFTVYLRFFNIRGFWHACQILVGRYDRQTDAGEVSHFQALSSALSGTVGLGNIAGVTIAMTIGGPGAFFWMLVSGFLGMSLKFVECTLAVKYRHVDADGVVLGGPMRYLSVGLAERNMATLGITLSVLFSFMCLLGSLGGGNMLQANQSGAAMLQVFQNGSLERLNEINQQARQAAEAGDLAGLQEILRQQKEQELRITRFASRFSLWYGVVLAVGVGVVVMGGIKRIGAAADKLVPGMCVLYSGVCLYIILSHLDRLPEVIGQVFSDAFTGQAAGGGLIGALVIGIQRAAFSNEAGAGSAPIAHSAARTNEPIREGCVALLEPFIDTIVICSMTALVILVTGAWNNETWVVEQGLQGSALTSRAFQEEVRWFPIPLAIAVALFAYSTILSWSYYGERSWAYLFGTRWTFLYKILMLVCVVVGSVVNLGSVLDFSDIMILSMAFPNLVGLYLLAPNVKQELLDYWARYRAGEFEPERQKTEANQVIDG